MKALDDNELDRITGGTGNAGNANAEKWAAVGIRIVETYGFPEYYLIKDGSRISPQKALEIYNARAAGTPIE